LTVAQEIAAAVAVNTPPTTNSLRRLTSFLRQSGSGAGESGHAALIGFRWVSDLRFAAMLMLEWQNRWQRKESPNTPDLYPNEF